MNLCSAATLVTSNLYFLQFFCLHSILQLLACCYIFLVLSPFAFSFEQKSDLLSVVNITQKKRVYTACILFAYKAKQGPREIIFQILLSTLGQISLLLEKFQKLNLKHFACKWAGCSCQISQKPYCHLKNLKAMNPI